MDDLKISDLIQKRTRPLLSFEFFPPKDDKGMQALTKVAEQLYEIKPDFVTCTWGAGGSTREKTLSICELLRDIGYATVMPHLTCVGVNRNELLEIADEIYNRKFKNIMTLRGDPPRGETKFRPADDGLSYAGELVTLLKSKHPDFCCGVAGYPEVHPEATSPTSDIKHLKEKLSAGGEFITTQLFYANNLFFDYEQRCKQAGIKQPILPGLLPVFSLSQVKRIIAMCKAAFPVKFEQQLLKVGDDKEEMEAVGTDWAIRQIKELLAAGVPGIHLYILNRSKAALTPALKECFNR